MKIAFDAKRIYQNQTGLGNYSRTLVSSLATFFPQNEYWLYAPKITSLFNSSQYPSVFTKVPDSFPGNWFKSAWRSKWVIKDLIQNNIDIYHGLSHEIPLGIQNTNIKSVVTIHDLIFEKYPEQFNKIDVIIYRKKFKNACDNANKIIAISEQTKKDIIELYKIDPAKIVVCYQSCNPSFAIELTAAEKQKIKERYHLPDQFLLYVGSIIERKNLLSICKALKLLPENNKIPLVVIGRGDGYKKKVLDYIQQENLSNRILFLSDQADINSIPSFKSGEDFPGIYQLATALIYPSVYEGFGIPILEAMWSQLPVITSSVSCLPETGGDAALYVNPESPEEIAFQIQKIIMDADLVKSMKEKGWVQAQKFTVEKCASDVLNVYRNL